MERAVSNKWRLLAKSVALCLALAVTPGCGGGGGGSAPVGDNPPPPPDPPPPPPPDPPPDPPPSLVEYTEDRVPCAGQNALRDVYFGDLHIHTTYSMDAWTFRNTLEPRDSYAHAKNVGLDFAAVTDHAEFLGELQICTTAGSFGYDDTACVNLRDTSLTNTERRFDFSVENTQPDPMRISGVCGDSSQFCVQDATAQWQAIQDQAAEHYEPFSDTCDFTTLIGYEWTGVMFGFIHRNVLFRNADVPALPISHFEAPKPEQLWIALEDECLDVADSACDAMAIPHNSNAGNGEMFRPQYDGAFTISEEKEVATRRVRLEPLMETFQHKGQSECEPGFIDAFGTVDEMCDYEDATEGQDQDVSPVPGDYLRGALGTGLSEQARLDVNPFKLGVIASSDTHNSATTVDEADYEGNLGQVDREVRNRLFGQNAYYNPGGLAGVWAIENSRDAIFDALTRREVFGTSGPRIAPRFFGGWDLDPTACERVDRLQYAYDNAAPMGGDLSPAPADGAPGFLLWALADQMPLQQLQIIKGYLDVNGEPQTAVYAVAGDPDNGASVDTNTCQAISAGEMELCTVWTDPDFKTDQSAHYYVRVLEDPTCRWSTRDCNSLSPDQRETLDGCQPGMPTVVQERAFTSPIWYTPE